MKAPIPCQFEEIKLRKGDRTFAVIFRTQELHPNTIAELFEMIDKLGYIFFHEQAFTEIDTKDLPPVERVRDRSQSQRLRDALYKLYEKDGGEPTFEPFYNRNMEKLIDFILSKID